MCALQFCCFTEKKERKKERKKNFFEDRWRNHSHLPKSIEHINENNDVLQIYLLEGFKINLFVNINIFIR